MTFEIVIKICKILTFHAAPSTKINIIYKICVHFAEEFYKREITFLNDTAMAISFGQIFSISFMFSS